MCDTETLEEHIDRHRTPPELICDHCNILFYDKPSLKKHHEAFSGETPYPCDQCDRTFPTRYAIRAHQTAKHERKPHVCDILRCEKSSESSATFGITKHQGTVLQALNALIAGETSAASIRISDGMRYSLHMHILKMWQGLYYPVPPLYLFL